ncbi:MAG: class I SAM-dependent methyltransferase [Thaumarchaeota archaeon]|nr:class I SAM-dependent methyltransferase [Nitrososphaerota archaeon]
MESWKLEDRQAEDSTAGIYDHLYHRTIFAKSMYGDFAQSIVSRTQKGKVLELACGTAIISNILPSQKLERFCVDFSWNMLQIAKSKCQNCLQADIDYLPILDSSFDVVYIHSALHHFPNLLGIFKEVKRILKGGGYFIIQEPNSHNLRKDSFLRICSFLFKILKTRRYEDLSHLEIKPSEHHGTLKIDAVLPLLETLDFAILEKGYRYYSSQILSGYDSLTAHKVGRFFDKYYVRKKNDGYMFLIVGKKKN